MGTITASTGLFSGIDFDALIEALSARQQRSVARLQARGDEFQAIKTGFEILDANLLSIQATATSFTIDNNFDGLKVNNPQESSLQILANDNAVTGTYKFQAVRKASTDQAVSRGYAASTQTVGAGTLVIANGGELNPTTLLETLNGGSGVSRGEFQITDRSGASAKINISDAITVDDVIDRINQNVDIGVTASAVNGQLILQDTTGSTSNALQVVDLNGGSAAEDLGIEKSVSASTLTGDTVYQIDETFSLDLINDGNGLFLTPTAPDIKLTLKDDSTFEVTLDGSTTLKDVVDKINNHEDNGGNLSAVVQNGRIELTDNTGGSNTLTVEDINGSKVVSQLGINVTESSGQILGKQLGAGINSVLLRNLRGGQGIDQSGEISLTDRSGRTATIDLSNAESLNEVLYAINSAVDGSSNELQIQARINSVGTGIEIVDTSGATASNLIIADVGGSTIATQLGIAIDDAVTTLDSGSLSRRYVNESTSLSNYAPDGLGVATGSIQITDSAGNVGVISISSAVKTVGDVIDRINANTAISVTAQLNETGDGFVLIDEAGGSETLTVEEFEGGSTAADLRILGEGVDNGGQQEIVSRLATVVEVESTDTLDSIITKINADGGLVNASILDDGSTFNSTRISLTSTQSGRVGRLIIDDGGLGLDFGKVVEGDDAVLRLGDDISSSFLITSNDNNFDSVVTGLEIEILDTSDTVAEVDVARDTDKTKTVIQNFVTSYNTLISTSGELTKFDTETNQRGILQGDSLILRMLSRLDSSVTGTNGDSSSEINSLIDIGIRVGNGGRLIINESRLNKALQENNRAVADFFLNDDNGFGKKLGDTLKSFTDPIDGTLTLQKNTIDANIEGLEQRIEDLGILLEQRQNRLLLEFAAMEEALSGLNAQQQALAAFQPVQVVRTNNSNSNR